MAVWLIDGVKSLTTKVEAHKIGTDDDGKNIIFYDEANNKVALCIAAPGVFIRKEGVDKNVKTI